MAESVVKLRWRGTVFLVLVLAVILYGQWYNDVRLVDVALFSGWLLVGLHILLATYNLRKKISSLPMGRVWYWRRVHSFLGWLTVTFFLIHAGIVPPAGWLNLSLWLMYMLLLLSGILGLWFTLTLPPRIAAGGERIQFERVPHLREAQYRRAEYVVLAASATGGGLPLLEFHNLHLRSYLSRSREYFRHCVNRAEHAGRLLQQLKSIDRHVDPDSRKYVAELEEIIQIKQNLDRQYALQMLLRKWTYVHIALNYTSWVFILLHAFVIYTFRQEYGL